jgi:hypothetical protein
MDMREGKVSNLVGFLESEHRRASESQHVRSVVFNESLPRCQALNHAIFRPASISHKYLVARRGRQAYSAKADTGLAIRIWQVIDC